MIAAALALVAALFFAVAASLQQHASRLVAAEGRKPTRRPAVLARFLPILLLLRRLLRHPVWLFGWGINLLGFLTQALALHRGSVALVQPLLATQLVFALPLSSMWMRRWPLPRDWLAVALICSGVAVFLSVEAAPQEGPADEGAVVLALVVALAVVALLVVAARGRVPTLHAATVGTAAGICFAASAVLMKLTMTALVENGVAATALDWPGYTLAASTAIGLLLGQQAYAAGSLPVAIAATTVANAVVSYLIGILAFDVQAPTGASTLTAVALSLLLLSLGAVGLAHSPTIQRDVSQAAGTSRV